MLPAHLESNFINPEYAARSPRRCLRSPRAGACRGGEGQERAGRGAKGSELDFAAADILAEIERAAPDVGIVTLAPELDGGLDLIRWLVARGHRVSLGHSGGHLRRGARGDCRRRAARDASLQPHAAARPSRARVWSGAVLHTDEVAAEIICDGVHVHPALVRTAIAAKRPSRIFAITDATAAAGLPVGVPRQRSAASRLRPASPSPLLEDGTIAGSVLTMDRAFQTLVEPCRPVAGRRRDDVRDDGGA